MDKLILARQCLNFKGFSCDNTDCKNKSCPLHNTVKDNHDNTHGKPTSGESESSAEVTGRGPSSSDDKSPHETNNQSEVKKC